jgi:hypothetical protein
MVTSSGSLPNFEAESASRMCHAPCSRNLVLVRAGRNSLHPKWVKGNGIANFDLLVVSYEADAPVEGTSIPVHHFPGRKIEGYNALFSCRQDLLEMYDYIAFFDDDLEIAKADINRLFEIGRKYKLDLFQPSLSWDSYFSYAATLTSGKFTLRYTNVVEMMCPVFSVPYLRRALPLFGLGYELGIDLIWSRLSDAPWFRFAVVDDVVVRHTRPVGASKVQHTSALHGVVDHEIAVVLDRFGATFHGIVAYAAIDKGGKAVLSRLLIAAASLRLWLAWFRSPMRPYHFTRFVSDYARHCLLRPINVDRIDSMCAEAPPVGRPAELEFSSESAMHDEPDEQRELQSADPMAARPGLLQKC